MILSTTNKVQKAIYVVFLPMIILAIGCAGCTSYDARLAFIIPSDFDLTKKHPYTVAINPRIGGGSLGSSISSIRNEDFTNALRFSMEKSHLFLAVTDSNTADYTLYVTIENYDKPFLGFDFDVKTQTKWELKQAHTGQTVWVETIETSYKVKTSEELIGVVRLQKAAEGSIKANIRQGIERLSMATF